MRYPSPYSTDGNVSTYQFYNDLIADYDDIIGSSPSTVLGIQMSAQKGIAGRGVLLDWAGWMEATNQSYAAFNVNLTYSSSVIEAPD